MATTDTIEEGSRNTNKKRHIIKLISYICSIKTTLWAGVPGGRVTRPLYSLVLLNSAGRLCHIIRHWWVTAIGRRQGIWSGTMRRIASLLHASPLNVYNYWNVTRMRTFNLQTLKNLNKPNRPGGHPKHTELYNLKFARRVHAFKILIPYKTYKTDRYT